MFRPDSALSKKLDKKKLRASKMRRPPVNTSGKGKIMGGPSRAQQAATRNGGFGDWKKPYNKNTFKKR